MELIAVQGTVGAKYKTIVYVSATAIIMLLI